jgi:mannose-6-phosphate isomerase
MRPYPLTFIPLLKHRVWGGRRLEKLGKHLPSHQVIGESWELADLPDSIEGGRSQIANGPLAGRTLREAIAAHRTMIMGRQALTPEGGFPLLIKFLDARENLSVQVHPDEAYVQRHPEAHLKSEAWCILDAAPGAVIYKGIRPGVRREEFARHIAAGTAAADLVAVPAIPGECHYLPSGACHALGAGVLVAEVQTPSDTTFRVYDWGRQGRELHVEQALACIRFDGGEDEAPALPEPIESDGVRSEWLARTDYFTIERVSVAQASELPVTVSGEPAIWVVIEGGATIEPDGADDVDAPMGTTLLFPAEITACRARFRGPSSLLRIKLPSWATGKLA